MVQYESMISNTHPHMHRHSPCVGFIKLWHFPAVHLPLSSPPLFSSSAPIQQHPDGGACLSYRCPPAGVRIGDLGVSPSPSSLPTLKEGTVIWHASHTLINNYGTHEGHTKTHMHTHTCRAHPNFMAASCVDLRGKIIILKRKYCLTPFSWHVPLYTVIICSVC